MSGARIRAALQKEFRQVFRDPVILFLVLWLYTAEVVICALTLTFDLREEPVALLDLDRSAASWLLSEQIDRTSAFDVRFRPGDEREIGPLLDEGRARLVAVIPVDYGEQLERTRGADVQLVVDGTNSLLALTAIGEMQRLMLSSSLAALREPARSVIGSSLIDNRVRIAYNPGLRYVYSVLLSMIAQAAFMVGVLLPAASIVREKERGTMEQLLVSPLLPAELILAKTLPTLFIGMISLGPSILIARAFGVPLHGDPLTLAILSGALLTSAVAIGVLIASAVRTLQQALLVAFFVLFPVLFLSGTMTPIESMPAALQGLSRLSPLRYYMDALLGVFLKGVGLDVLWPQLLWMLGIGAVLFFSSGLLFMRRLA
jgi:ABC-2 type transport system permease protein